MGRLQLLIILTYHSLGKWKGQPFLPPHALLTVQGTDLLHFVGHFVLK